MPFTLTMPKLSPTMDEGTITKWHKTVGDHVSSGDLLFEVATDKATVEHFALDEGWIRKILVEQGVETVVNQPIAIMTSEKEESIEGYHPENIKTVEPEKPTFTDAPTPVTKEIVKAKSESTGSGLVQPKFVPEPPLKANYSSVLNVSQDRNVKASPLAKKLAKEKNLDLSSVRGSGPEGRIMSRDLMQAQTFTEVRFGQNEAPLFASGTFDEVPLSPIRKIIAQRLQESKTFIPHFYVTQKINPQPLLELREQLKSYELNFTINDFFIRAVALALRKHPEINSGFNSETQSIIRFKTVDISVAVSLQEGLVTPIVRHADYKNLSQISLEVKGLSKKAKEGRLSPEEYKGGSFTISNLGMFGIKEFQAIINPPQAAIIAISGLQDVAVVKEGQVVPGKEMNLTLSVDHRVIDGAEAAVFLNTLKKIIESPSGLLIS